MGEHLGLVTWPIVHVYPAAYKAEVSAGIMIMNVGVVSALNTKIIS